MDNKEAIKILSDICKAYRNFSTEEIRALELAIKAIEQQDKTEKLLSVGVLKDCESCKVQKHCIDAISRSAVINAFGLSEKTRKYGGDHSGYNTMMLYEVQEIIEGLPPVTPQQKDEDIVKAFQVGLALGFGKKYDEMDKVIEEVKKAVIPQPKMGKWEQTRYRSIDQTGESYDDGIGFRCLNCANVFKVTSLARYHFCPNCGAKMQEVEET